MITSWYRLDGLTYAYLAWLEHQSTANELILMAATIYRARRLGLNLEDLL